MNKFEIYNRAADLLKECGWIQGGYRDRTGGFCAVGAIAAAMREMGKEPSDSADTMEHYVETTVLQAEDVKDLTEVPLTSYDREVPGGILEEWNDTRGRTRADVVTKLRNLAEKYRQA